MVRHLIKKENSKSSFLILKDSTGYSAFVMTILADSSYLKGEINKLNALKYNHRDEDFSGMVAYFTPKGQLINVWRYVDGKIVMNSNGNLNTNQIQSISGTVKKPNFQQKECYDYYWVETTNGNVDRTYYAFTICFDNGGGGGGDGDGPGSPNVSPDQPQPNCSVPTHGQSLKTNFNVPPDNPGDGGGTGYPQPSQCPTFKNLPSNMPSVDDITNNVQNPCLQAIIETIIYSE